LDKRERKLRRGVGATVMALTTMYAGERRNPARTKRTNVKERMKVDTWKVGCRIKSYRMRFVLLRNVGLHVWRVLLGSREERSGEGEEVSNCESISPCMTS
jgi:hypothetical protein